MSDELREALIDAMPREWTTYAIRNRVADALLSLVEARVQAAANQRAAEELRAAVGRAYERSGGWLSGQSATIAEDLTARAAALAQPAPSEAER